MQYSAVAGNVHVVPWSFPEGLNQSTPASRSLSAAFAIRVSTRPDCDGSAMAECTIGALGFVGRFQGPHVGESGIEVFYLARGNHKGQRTPRGHPRTGPIWATRKNATDECGMFVKGGLGLQLSETAGVENRNITASKGVMVKIRRTIDECDVYPGVAEGMFL